MGGIKPFGEKNPWGGVGQSLHSAERKKIIERETSRGGVLRWNVKALHKHGGRLLLAIDRRRLTSGFSLSRNRFGLCVWEFVAQEKAALTFGVGVGGVERRKLQN